MSIIKGIFIIFVTALVSENAVMMKGFLPGAGGREETSSLGNIRYYSITMTAVTLISSVLGWAFNSLIKHYAYASFIRPVVFTVIISLLSLAAVFLADKVKGWGGRMDKNDMCRCIFFNCLVLGTMLYSCEENYTLLQTVMTALGAGIGYMAALLVIWEGKRRFALMNVPKLFKGIPVLMLYLGLISLALMGFSNFGLLH